jgi:leader peptidase (prepilin peptidase)/N-methyltransferase
MLVFGLVVGSFLNVCIYRIPKKIFAANLRSMCPSCGQLIPAWHNIPVISWLVLRGRARCCGARISVQYPIVEMATGILFIVAYAKFPFFDSGYRVLPENFLRFFHLVVFMSAMIVCGVIDFHHKIIPDIISLGMLTLTPVVVFLHPDLTWQSALFGVVLGGGSLYAVAWVYFLLRRQAGLGMGDVKLLAVIGGWLGIEALLPTVMMASVSGAVFSLLFLLLKRGATLKTAIPFGPFLILGATLHILVGWSILEWLG